MVHGAVSSLLWDQYRRRIAEAKSNHQATRGFTGRHSMTNQQPSPKRPRLRSADVARYLGVSHQRIAQMVAEGKLPAQRHDHHGPSWTPTAIERWAQREWWGTKPWRTPLRR